MKKYKYFRRHAPTGSTDEALSTQSFMSRLEFLEALNKWNAQNPTVWHYWHTVPQAIEALGSPYSERSW